MANKRPKLEENISKIRKVEVLMRQRMSRHKRTAQSCHSLRVLILQPQTS